MNGGPHARVSSPSGLSTLMTSAPRSASVCPVVGPAKTRASSTTRTPERAAVIAEDPAFCHAREKERPAWRIAAGPLHPPSHDPRCPPPPSFGRPPPPAATRHGRTAHAGRRDLSILPREAGEGDRVKRGGGGELSANATRRMPA